MSTYNATKNAIMIIETRKQETLMDGLIIPWKTKNKDFTKENMLSGLYPFRRKNRE